MGITKLVATMVVAGSALLSPVMAADSIVIGLSGAVTGRFAGTYGPTVESFQLYVNQLNARGGINGTPIALEIRDNQGNPSIAATDVKKFTGQDDMVLMINVGPSSTFGPMIAESKRAEIPLMFIGGACPDEVLPPTPAKYLFCTIAASTKYDAEMALAFIKNTENAPKNLGLVAMAIPLSRAGIDYAESISGQYDLTTVDKEMIPPPTANYSPFASKLKDAGSDWVYSWAPWVTQIRAYEALRNLGWEGKYLAAALIPAEDEIERVKDEEFFVVGSNAFFMENTPAHQEIRAAAEGASLNYPVTHLADGWIAGIAIETALGQTAAPVTTENLLTTLNSLEVDTRGLRGGPLVWTETNHFRATQYSRVYRWDDAEGAITHVTDWISIEVK